MQRLPCCITTITIYANASERTNERARISIDSLDICVFDVEIMLLAWKI